MNPSLAFITPVMPQFSGNGLAMRAAHNLRALAEKFTVHLLVIALYPGDEETPAGEIAGLCASWKRIDPRAHFQENVLRKLRKWFRRGPMARPPEWDWWNSSTQKEADAYLAAQNCLNIWVFRFYMFPWVEHSLRRGLPVRLDLDELESSTRERLAALHEQLGQSRPARQGRREAAAFRDCEKIFLPLFRGVVTSSRLETERLRTILPRVTTWPNIISRAPQADPPRPDRTAGTLLFVGNAAYFPNRDAIRQATEEVLPRLQRRIGSRPLVLRIAGSNMDEQRTGPAELPQVEWLGYVADLTPVYAAADLVIVPLRTGGGTRIKILEAFAHRKAVVSTRIGAEGLAVAHDRELLLADDPDEFAAVAADLLLNAEKRDRLAAAGYAFVAAHHSEDNLRPQVAALAAEAGEALPQSPGG